MTLRPTAGVMASQLYHRSKRWCNLWRIERADGEVVRLTDHNRELVHEGETYSPLGFGSYSAERRDAALHSGSVEAIGLIMDGVITIPEVLAGVFRGAVVRHRIVDWTCPDRVHYRATKWVAFLGQDGEGWKASLEGRSQQMQRPVGGRFGGIYKAQCGYRLGDPDTCKAVVAPEMNPTDSGTPSSGTSDPSLLYDTTKTWGDLTGYHVYIDSGVGVGQERVIASNTTTVLTVDRAWDTNPTTGSTYQIGLGCTVVTVGTQYQNFFITPATIGTFADDWFRDGEAEFTTGENAGQVLPILHWDDSENEVKLLIPAPFAIAIADKVILRPGCDGTRGTCIAKFSNIANFGGSPYDPDAGEAIEPPTADR